MDLDIAFNSRLYGYDVGKPSRRRCQVIRVRGHMGAPALANQIDNIMANDISNAGAGFSAREQGLLDAPPNLVVVVVGEYLPGLEVPAGKDLTVPGGRNSRISRKDFDSKIHTIIPTQRQAFLVVRYLQNQRGNLHVLVDKQDGLCATALLGSHAMDETRLFFYDVSLVPRFLGLIMHLANAILTGMD